MIIEAQIRGRLATTDQEVLKAALHEITQLRKQITDIPVNSIPWLTEARKHLGLQEYPGSKHNPQILEWWRKIRAPFTDDETPWCAAFVGGCLEAVGIVSSRSAAARSYNNWGVKIDAPAVGCIVVFWRGSRDGWKGHVGYCVGQDIRGRLLILGGNQGNRVSIAPKPHVRVLSYRWPKSHPLPSGRDLPVLEGAMTSGET